jgi:small subunit ribosomal protein S6e
MPYKINISNKGKTYKVETEAENLVGTKISDKIKGEDVSPELAGYELEITGTSDKAGFPGFKNLKGSNLRKVLVTYGPGMKNRPRKEGKKPTPNNKGLKLRKTFRGNEISSDTVQINIKVLKEGTKKFDDLIKPKEEAKPEEKPAEEKPKAEEEKPEEVKEEKPAEEKPETKENTNS